MRVFLVHVLLLPPALGLGHHPALILAEALHQAADRALQETATNKVKRHIYIAWTIEEKNRTSRLKPLTLYNSGRVSK